MFNSNFLKSFFQFSNVEELEFKVKVKKKTKKVKKSLVIFIQVF